MYKEYVRCEYKENTRARAHTRANAGVGVIFICYIRYSVYNIYIILYVYGDIGLTLSPFTRILQR